MINFRILVASTFFALSTLAVAQQEPTSNPIHDASKAGDTQRLANILAEDPEAWKIKNQEGNLPLHIAAWNGQDEAVSLLIKHGADVTALGYDKWTPLHFAARGGHTSTCRILLDNAADPSAKNGIGRTARQSTQNSAIRLLLRSFHPKVPGRDDFHAAAASGDLKTLQSLHSKHPDLVDAKAPFGITALMKAAAENQATTLTWLINQGADIDAVTDNGYSSALYLACAAGHLDAVKLLIGHAAKLNPTPDKKNAATVLQGSPLSAAAFSCTINQAHSENLTRLFGMAAEDSESSAPDTSSELAALTGDQTPLEFFNDLMTPEPEPTRIAKREIIKLLLAKGADPNQQLGIAPLTAATMSSDTESVRLLLQADADPNQIGSNATPLGTAVMMGVPPEIIRLLLDHGADPFLKSNTSNSKSTFDIVRSHNSANALRQIIEEIDLADLSPSKQATVLTQAARYPTCLKLALDAGLDVNLADKMKQTALHIAAKQIDPEPLRLLLQAGADVTAKDFAGFTPLHNAAEYAQHKNVALILETETDLEAITNNGATPLMAACSAARNPEAAAKLIAAGANLEARDSTYGRSPLIIAASVGGVAIVRQLINAGADVHATANDLTTLSASALAGSLTKRLKPRPGFGTPDLGTEQDFLEITRLLISKGTDVERGGTKKHISTTPLEAALQSGSEKMVKLLLEANADPNAKNPLKQNRTPIYAAIAGGHPQMLELVLDLKVDVNARATNKITPLHFAAGLDHSEMVQTLLDHGASINARQAVGATPLFHAVHESRQKGLGSDSIRVLLFSGADPKITAQGGWTPLEIAENLNRPDLVKLLSQPRFSP